MKPLPLIFLSLVLAGCGMINSPVEGTEDVDTGISATCTTEEIEEGDTSISLTNPAEKMEEVDMSFSLTSPAFEEGQAIPAKYTCDGEDTSPVLAWNEPPAGTLSLALIMDDPDAPAGTWVHWVIYNIPADIRSLPEAVPIAESLSDGGLQGINTSRDLGYGGPCPPSGTHRYYFKLYALDIMLDNEAGLDKNELLSLMEGHILAQCQLMGTYSR